MGGRALARRYAGGTVRLAAQHSALTEYDLNAVDRKEHILALATCYGTFATLLRESIEASEKRNDPITADLFTEVGRGGELDPWFLESHLTSS